MRPEKENLTFLLNEAGWGEGGRGGGTRTPFRTTGTCRLRSWPARPVLTARSLPPGPLEARRHHSYCKLWGHKTSGALTILIVSKYHRLVCLFFHQRGIPQGREFPRAESVSILFPAESPATRRGLAHSRYLRNTC